MFERKGYIVVERDGLDLDEDDMLLAVIEAGGEDMEASDDVFEIYTQASDFTDVVDELEKDFTLAHKELTMVPNIKVSLSEEDENKLNNLVDALEDDDDVNEVYTNAE